MIARSFVAGVMGLALSALSAPSLAAPPATAVAEAPRIIPQTDQRGLTTAAAWTPDSRHIVTGDWNELILWDVAGHIVDRHAFPRPTTGQLGPVESVKVLPDGSGAEALAPVYGDGFEILGARRFAWRFGSGSMQSVAAPAPARLAAMTAEQRQKDLDRKLAAPPASPDGRYRLEPSVFTLIVHPTEGGAAVALLGQAGLTDFGLSAAAGNETSGRDSRTPEQEDEENAAVNVESSRRSWPSVGDDAATWAPSPDGRLLAWTGGEGHRTWPGAAMRFGIGAFLHVMDLETGAPRLPMIYLLPGFGDLQWAGPETLLAPNSVSAEQPIQVDTSAPKAELRSPRLCYTRAVGTDGSLVGAGAANCQPAGCWPELKSPSQITLTAEDMAACDALIAREPAQGIWIVRPDGSRRALDTSAFPAAVPIPGHRAYKDAPPPPADDELNAVEALPRFARLLASPDGSRLAALHTSGETMTLAVWDVATGRLLTRIPGADPLVFSADGSQIVTDTEGHLDARDSATGKVLHGFGRRGTAVRTSTIEDGSAILLQTEDGRVTRHDILTGRPMGISAPLPTGREYGALGSTPLLWSRPSRDVMEVYPAQGRQPLFTVYLLPQSHFFAFDPQGRYDSDLPPDSHSLRWLMGGSRLQSLAPQTFMRDYYEPGLMRRAMECARNRDCPQPLRPVRSQADLNQLVPETRILSVRYAGSLDRVLVDLEVTEAVDPQAPNRKTRSGAYDLRLFLDGRLVGETPPPPAAKPGAAGEDSIASWRPQAALSRDSHLAVARHTFEVRLPTTAGFNQVMFTAYAFNEDRVKGETDSFRFLRQAMAPHTPHAYVISIGVNAYAIPGKSLSFAVNDARAVADAFQSVRGYEVVPITLTAEAGPGHATKADLRAVLARLAGERDAESGRLLAAGIDGNRLQKATPDDVLILSFSGHGYTDEAGRFFLLPSDAALTREGRLDLNSLVSSAELTDWLRNVDTHETTIIIDACHSGASVTAGGFKPGPMGDPGLGQLAFDKGIRILVAAQADDVAMEDGTLQQGLLTYALTHDGLASAMAPQEVEGAERDATQLGYLLLNSGPGPASPPGHKTGEVRLDSLLKYAVSRMPGLAEKTIGARLAGREVQPMLVPRTPAKRRPVHVQQPVLFDFTRAPSTVRLTVSPLAAGGP